MTLKLIFSPEGVIYGAQVTGYEGVDARIDMIAAVMGMNGTVFDLGEVEHAYAPPFSSAKDPVNAAGLTAENIVRGLVSAVTWKDVARETGSFILDVRTRQEFAAGSIPGSVNIPVDELREYLDRVPRDRKIIIACAAGLRGYLASRVLTQNGFDDVWNLSGGYRTWYAVTSEQRHASSGEYIGSDDMIYNKTDCHGRC
jgi:rhodanese-related sulfurtransferase